MREKNTEQLLREENGILYRQKGDIRAALVFPNSYYLGMSSLGFQVILDEINRHPGASCERVFYHGGSDAAPRSFETQELLSEFDIVGFSISFELDYLNVVKILHTAKIPLRAEDRGSQDPLVIAGGICSTFNPEPISGFVDAFVIGDGEEVVYSLLSEYHSWRKTEKSRQELLYRLSGIKGVYVPALYDVSYEEDGRLSGLFPKAGVKSEVERASLGELDKFDTTSKILSSNTEFSGSFLVEVTRGCAHRCKFCVASYSQRCRIRSEDVVIKLAQSKLSQSAERIGLVGSSVTDHPRIDKIATSLVDMGKKISIASMRADSVNDALLDALAAGGQKTVTLAPEAASLRLRKVIGKNIDPETIFQIIRSALRRGIVNIKLYFMIGLPTETQKDVDSIVTMARHAKQLMLDSKPPGVTRSPGLTVSVSPFVPKPHTPFQWCQMEDVKTLSQKLKFLRKELGKIGGIRIPTSSARLSAMQGVLSRGDRRLVGVLRDIAENSVSWSRALRNNGLSQEFYLQRHRQFGELFPWDHLKLGIPKARLAERLKSNE